MIITIIILITTTVFADDSGCEKARYYKQFDELWLF